MGKAQQTSADIFFEKSDLTLPETIQLVTNGLLGSDFGEFYQEIKTGESFSKTKGKYQNIGLGSRSSGFGFRVGQKEKIGFAYSDQFNRASLTKAIASARNVLGDNPSQDPQKPENYGPVSQTLYPSNDLVGEMDERDKMEAIDKIEQHIMSMAPNIVNVSIGHSVGTKKVHIITADGQSLVDTRSTATLSISIQVEGKRTVEHKAKKKKKGPTKNGKKTTRVVQKYFETGTGLASSRTSCHDLFNKASYEEAAQKALKIAQDLLIAKPAPGGQMPIVLAPGWAAVLLHEAVGHGLEGDFNRKGISVYSGKVGQKVASSLVTVIEQGDLPGERGSLHFDDEGIQTQQNVLIKDGILQGYIHDRQNAQLMGVKSTGNGRRESYAHMPMPRMTNTYYKNGDTDPADIIASVENGIYMSDLAGGSVNITSGKFEMNATLAYIIRNGQICEPVKGATIIGDGQKAMETTTAVGNDLAIEKNAGMCGKEGQSVPVGCGQPTLRVDGLTVGGMG